MRFSAIFSLASMAAIVSASPIFSRGINSSQPFYLVTTDSSASSTNSSLLSNVSLTTLFDPQYQPDYLLRLIDPGYGSVPTFTLTDGVLHTREAGPHGIGSYVYNSTEIHTGSELQFRAEYEGTGDLSLKNGYLLGVNGSTSGWAICPQEFGQRVIEWKGIDAGCTPTYIQAVLAAPY